MAVVGGEPEMLGGWFAAAEGAKWTRLAKARADETRRAREARGRARFTGNDLRRNRQAAAAPGGPQLSALTMLSTRYWQPRYPGNVSRGPEVLRPRLTAA